MKLRINGIDREIETVASVQDLVTTLGFVDRPFALALNLKCIAKQDFPTTTLHEGDAVEILAPMQGG